MKAAIEALLDFAGVASDDRVVLAIDPAARPHPKVLDAIEAAIRARGAEPRVEGVPAFEPRLHDVPASYVAAMERSDVVIDLAGRESLPHAATPRRRMSEHGLRLVACSLRDPCSDIRRLAVAACGSDSRPARSITTSDLSIAAT